MSIHDHIESMEKALEAGDYQRARRYLSKLREGWYCAYCGGRTFLNEEGVEQHYNGVVHTRCLKEREESKS